jgi:hypothetical protein
MDVGALYDSFPEEARDISRDEFIRQVRGLTNQRLMQRDLKKIMNQKQETRTRNLLAANRKKKIDDALRK